MQRREVAASSFLRLLLHVVQVDFEGADRNLDFPDRHAQRTDQQQQRRAEDIGRKDEKSDIQQEHRHHAEKKARNAQNLHRAREVQAAAQVVDLRAGDFRRVLEVLLLERAHQLGVRKKTVGVGQQNQRNG